MKLVALCRISLLSDAAQTKLQSMCEDSSGDRVETPENIDFKTSFVETEHPLDNTELSRK